MLSLGTTDMDDGVEDWLGVPVFFARRFVPETNERLLRETGFHLEFSEVREELEARYGVVRFHWVRAKKPGGP